MIAGTVLFEMMLRGLAVGALASIVIGWRRAGASRDAQLAGLLFLACVTAFAINSAPALGGAINQLPPLVLLASATPGALWLCCAVLFEDRKIGWAALAPTLALLAITGAAMLIPPPDCAPVWLLGDIVRAILCLALLAILWRDGRNDLVESRRRLRGPLVAAIAVYAIIQAWIGVTAKLGLRIPGHGIDSPLVTAVILTVLAVAGAFALQAPAVMFVPVRRATASTIDDSLKTQDRQALDRLTVLMDDGDLWRREGLTIGDVAREVGVAEHRLRRLINSHLGHRNFAAFLNARRVGAAKALLAASPDTAISTLAFDLGYASLGPFNRAFKDATGQTPSEFRRRALADS